VVSLDFFLPAAIHDALGPLELAGSINGFALRPETFAKPGHYAYHQPVPDSALISQPVFVEFTLNKALQPSGNDPRELGLVVASIRLS
jgi:hypothetical protein